MAALLCSQMIIAATMFCVFVGLPIVAESKQNEKSESRNFISNSRQTGIDLYNCTGVRTRRDIRDLSAEALQEWQSAITELINKRDNVTNSFWDSQVRVHGRFASEAHRTPYFFPWHRLFLLSLENVIRSRGRPNFALPYWDWSADASNAALSEIWTPAFIGGARISLGGAPLPIPNGPFSRMFALVPRRHRVRRNFTSGVSNGMDQLVGPSLLNLIINASNFPTFATNAETAHDIVHVAIGGDMGLVSRSPNDPVFYLHHGYMDYIYRKHQVLYGESNFGGVQNISGVATNADPERVLQAFGRRAKEGFSTPCVNYVPYSNGLPPMQAPRRPNEKSPGQIPESSKENPDLSVLEDGCHNERVLMGMPELDCMKAVADLRKLSP